MNKLDALILEYCPNGVIYTELQNMAEIGTGNSDRKDSVEDGIYPFYVRSKEVLRINKWEYDEEAIVIPGEGGIGEIFHFVNGKYALHQRAYRIHVVNPKLTTRFLYYYMSSQFKSFIMQKAVSATVTSIRKPMIEQFIVPVPPVEVQREIVRILDNFIGLSEQLETELSLRKQQYNYYRNLLLTLNESVPEYSMGDVLTFLNGRAYKQQELLDTGKYPVLRVGNFYTNSSWYYSDLELDDDKYCVSGDLLYSWAATLGPKIWDGEKCIFHYHIWKILFDEAKIDKMYLYYYLQYDLAEIAKSTTQSTMVHVSMGSMKERKIKLPSLDEQKRIAGLISHFDTLCSSVTSGLPAEIDARQRQFEYYRDKLLTFKKMGAAV